MDKFQMISEFKGFLRKGKVEFLYLKKDGTARFAYGTMCPEFLPKVEPKEVDETAEAKPKRKMKEGMIFYYDLEKGGYRSFHEDNLLSFPDPTSGDRQHGYKKSFSIKENIKAAFPGKCDVSISR